MGTKINWDRPLAAALLVLFLGAVGLAIGALALVFLEAPVLGAIGGGLAGVGGAVYIIRRVLTDNGDLFHYPPDA